MLCNRVSDYRGTSVKAAHSSHSIIYWVCYVLKTIYDYHCLYMHKTKIRFCNVKFRKLRFCLKQSPYFSCIMFSTILFSNLVMFWFLSTYEINLKSFYTYVDDMLFFFSKHWKPVTFCLGTLNVTNPNSEKCKISTDCRYWISIWLVGQFKSKFSCLFYCTSKIES